MCGCVDVWMCGCVVCARVHVCMCAYVHVMRHYSCRQQSHAIAHARADMRMYILMRTRLLVAVGRSDQSLLCSLARILVCPQLAIARAL